MLETGLMELADRQHSPIQFLISSLPEPLLHTYKLTLGINIVARE